MSHPVLVTGATGQQGGALARRLLADGVPVRALTRDTTAPAARELAALGAEVVPGAIDDPAALKAAATGASGVFSVQPVAGYSAAADFDETAAGKSLVDAAVAAGAGHLVYASANSAEVDFGIPHMGNKRVIEEYVAASGLSHTILRPTSFMENFLDARFGLRGDALAMALLPEVPMQLIALDDIAAVAAAAFADPAGYDGRVFELAGDVLTGPGIAAAIAGAVGREVAYTPIPLEELRKHGENAVRGFEALNSGRATRADIGALRAEFPALLDFGAWLASGGAEKLRAAM
ncbi:hypothetical protein Afil01_00500 [Actinorhabdospora filicis]|uniref:NmrA-like domain-containing protein n=1 Tax=Actinorhabdospora filicis TaxID=1785913 RepID=A0A9W6SF98_9ACTN|nr:NmrA family NAD(P)-binding protein [Actinorhabdospora filicis]GLZ75243.1 hypothetical protein Afil01_00500 [Actinorhabdospora filicis]